MKDYLICRLTILTRDFVNAQAAFMTSDEDEGDGDFPKNVEKLKIWLRKVSREAEFFGLPSVMRQADRISHSVDEWKASKIDSALEELERRFDEETGALRLFYIPSDRLVFYNKTDLFGETFKTNFPTANAEISEAGNCFAFDRFTACAFHLMRSLEVVLKVLFAALGLPAITTSGAQNWNGILREIKTKLETDTTIPDHAFYDGAYVFLAAAKNPMRNATMHVDAVYDESSVRSLYDAVGAFMRHIATKLKESP
jgi:hypothetical protein